MVNRHALLCLPCLLIIAAACSPPEPGPGELCEQSGTETGRIIGTMGPDDPGFESGEVRQRTRIGGRELESDIHLPGIPADLGDSRTAVTDPEELQSYPLRTVVRIEMNEPDEAGLWINRGTGFLVGPRHVLTNHHVVDDKNKQDINPTIMMDPDGFLFEVYPGRDQSELLNGGPWKVESVVYGPTAFTDLWWGGEDYALLILEDDPKRSGMLGRMGMCSPADPTIEELTVQTAGYPGDLQTCAGSPNMDGYCHGWMYKQECSVTDHDIYPEEFGHDCATAPGQSGSPLWVAQCGSSPAVCAIGIHTGPLGQEGRAKRLDPDTVNFLRQAICDSGSAYAPAPSFCP